MRKLLPLFTLLLGLLLLAGCKVQGGNADRTSTATAATAASTVRVTFPEGYTVREIAEKLEENQVCAAADFLAAASDPAMLEAFGFSVENAAERVYACEGYVFPDTYDFYIGESAESALRRFLRNTANRFDDALLTRCAEAGFTPDQVLTLASIIQEEAGNPAEMGKVSAVLHNRLNSSNFKRLQCDVTTVYLRLRVKPYVSQADYETYVSRYSTYDCEGLPAGPITNPGMDAILAALTPEETNDYFFVTDAAGNYYYAETWEEHQKNCIRAGL